MASPAPQMQSPTEMQPEMQPEIQSPAEMQSPAASPPGGDCASGPPESGRADASARYHPLVHLQYEIALDRREAGELSTAISFFVQ